MGANVLCYRWGILNRFHREVAGYKCNGIGVDARFIQLLLQVQWKKPSDLTWPVMNYARYHKTRPISLWTYLTDAKALEAKLKEIFLTAKAKKPKAVVVEIPEEPVSKPVRRIRGPPMLGPATMTLIEKLGRGYVPTPSTAV